MEFNSSFFALSALNDSGTFKGVASTAGENRNGYQYAENAFEASLAAHRLRGSMPAMLRHHKVEHPCGVWTDLQYQSGNLIVAGKLAVDTNDGGETYRLMKAGALTGLSTGCVHLKSTKGPNGVPTVMEADLLEISVVSVPANPVTFVTRVSSISGVRDIEGLFVEAGLSGRKAKAAASAAWRAIDSGDDEPSEDEIAALLEQSASRIKSFDDRMAETSVGIQFLYSEIQKISNFGRGKRR